MDSLRVKRYRFTGQARGFGFVEINDDAAAQRAIDGCNNKELMGRAVVVNEARPMALAKVAADTSAACGSFVDRRHDRLSYLLWLKFARQKIARGSIRF